ncbi:MAG: GIY-YIG nuclease family protein [Acidobacteriota bacterium]
MSESKRFVYVLRTVSDPPRYYTGLAADVRARLAAHNAGNSPQTAAHKPWRLHIVIHFTSEQRAAAFERYLKSASGRAFARKHFEGLDMT